MSRQTTFRVAIDTGGTFTDLVVDDARGRLLAFKASTTPDDPSEGIISALMKAAQGLRLDLSELLARTEMLIHGTTRALNAITVGQTARTAFVTTKGHPDILVYAEGGRSDLFNFAVPARRPYVPRALTIEADERIGADGRVVRPLSEAEAERVAAQAVGLAAQAVAVCLLWSPANPEHELGIEAAIHAAAPNLPVTLSHRLNPTLREYRRASSTAIDASLKPLMSDYLGTLERRLRERGFHGRLLVVTSTGGFQDAASVAGKPILSVKSGPAMAPVAGRQFAEREFAGRTAIVADTGGTTYDVSLVREGQIPATRETWIGPRYLGHMTGFSSVDVRSIGAGGGSVAWVDSGGVLHVGPHSAGSIPGPACYGLGGRQPTLTDACVVLGYIDPEFFLGGAMQLDVELAADALRREVAAPLGVDLLTAAEAVHRLATERMVAGIEDIALSQGADPAEAVLVAGGGAGGLNAAAIGRRLGCEAVVIPHAAPVMSAFGALRSELSEEFEIPYPSTSEKLDSGVDAVLDELRARCEAFAAGPGERAVATCVDFSVEARYPNQVWELAVPFQPESTREPGFARRLASGFHDMHERTFAVADRTSAVEFISWHARVNCVLASTGEARLVEPEAVARSAERDVYFARGGRTTARVHALGALAAGAEIAGPAIVESEMTTVVVEPGVSCVKSASGNLVLRLGPAA